MRASVPPTSIADLIRVAHRLGADTATLRAAAIMLGLAAPTSTGPASDLPPAPVSTPRRSPVPVPGRPAEPDGDINAVVRPAGSDPRPPRRFRLTLTEPPNAVPPRRLRGSVTDLLPPPPNRPTSPEPLFEPWHQRAVLSALAAIDRPGQDVDINAVVERVALREPVGVVPRLPEQTTRLGVQLLVDYGPSMGPFRRDLRLLAEALRRVASSDAVEVLAFRANLQEVVPLSGEDDEPRPYTPAGGSRPILVASDLGIAATGAITVRPVDWLALASHAKELGSPLVVLVPYPPARWPAWASTYLSLVHWDRPTNAGHARRAARRAAALAGLRR